MEKIKDSWKIIVFTMAITVLGNMIFSSFTSDRDAFKNMAPKDYVDKENEKQNTKITSTKTDLQKQIDKKADKEDLDSAIENINYTRDKVDKIYLLLIDRGGNDK